MNYYNEHDPKAAAWLRELIHQNLIPAGEVDTRSIHDVQPDDLRPFTQCHFFAGIGGWSRALDLAGWPATRPVWTGSCPCPPFSVAGKKKQCPECKGNSAICHPLETGVFACVDCGHEWFADARHLWPEFYRLIAQCRPETVFGEQVASPDGRVWLAGVSATLEAIGYGVGGADLCAAGVSAPHIRQRLWWVADAGHARVRRSTITGETAGGRTFAAIAGHGDSRGLADAEHAERRAIRECGENEQHRADGGREKAAGEPGTCGEICRLADATGGGFGIDGSASRDAGHADQCGPAGGLGHAEQPRLEGHARHGGDRHEPGRIDPEPAGSVAATGRAGRMADAAGRDTGAEREQRSGQHGLQPRRSGPGFWTAAEWLPCLDGKARRIEPGTFPLADGVPARVGRLRGYGNAIVPELAAEFIAAACEAVTDS